MVKNIAVKAESSTAEEVLRNGLSASSLFDARKYNEYQKITPDIVYPISGDLTAICRNIIGPKPEGLLWKS